MTTTRHSKRSSGLARAVVAKHVAELLAGAGVVQTLHGFEWGPWRLQSGGGIAGNSRVWWLVRRARASDDGAAGPIMTVAELRRVLTKFGVSAPT